MGCISTPIPNYLSTHLTTTSHFRSTTKPLIKEWVERRAERCGKGSDVEQMRRMVRSDELDEMMVRLSS